MGDSSFVQNPLSEPIQHQLSLDEIVLSRHSTRAFLDKPVPDDLLREALELASHAPSNSNTQVWRLYVVTGPALQRLKTVLRAEATSRPPPDVPPLPTEFYPSRSALGRLIYGEGYGIARSDQKARQEAVLRNYNFFGAPVGVIVCMSKELIGFSAMSVGMYLQTLLLKLTERGVGSCCQVSIAGYKDAVRKEVGIDEKLEILCGVSIGYEDPDFNVNKIRIDRFPVERTTVFKNE